MKILPLNSLPVLALVLLLGACISNRRSVYLQDKSQKRAHDAAVEHEFEDPYQEFVLEPGDVLSVNINHYQLTAGSEPSSTGEEPAAMRSVQHPYLSGLRIDESLSISLPVIGKVKVGGLTLDQAQLAIDSAASEFYASPTSKVFLMNFDVTVLGEVGRPGTYPVYDNKVTIFEALGYANDAGIYANREVIRISRTRGGKNRILHVDLTDENLLMSPRLYLQPNDVVMVKPLKRKKYTLNDSQGILRTISVALSSVGVIIALKKANE